MIVNEQGLSIGDKISGDKFDYIVTRKPKPEDWKFLVAMVVVAISSFGVFVIWCRV